MQAVDAVPIDPALATWDEPEPRLLGGRCRGCGTVTFPKLDGCPRCGSDGIEQATLSPRGTLWTWTTQGFLPKRPYIGPETADRFEPFLLGYVELPEGVKVEARLVDCDADTIEIGQQMQLAVGDLPTFDERGAVRTFAFRPATGGAA